MADCVICGDELHPERAERYDHCTKRECRERRAAPRTIASIGVNKASDQFVVLDERTRTEMASGRYKKQPEPKESSPRRSTARGGRKPGPAPVVVPRSSGRRSLPRWSDAQENLALTYKAMGMKPEEIANKLGVSPYLVTQILLAAAGRGRH